MCTSILYSNRFFGRNLDVFSSYDEKIMFIPRGTNFSLKRYEKIKTIYSIIGIGKYYDSFPFFFDAINEKGIGISGLNFVGNAYYNDYNQSKINLAPYELILYLLGHCSSLNEVIEELKNINILNQAYNDYLPLSELHFMIVEKGKSVVVESTINGLKIYENKLDVLTNNPEFSYHFNNVKQYLNLSLDNPQGYISLGQGLFGLPGDYSSMSRFIKAYCVKKNILESKTSQKENINQFFYILDSVLMPKGLVKLNNNYEYTLYSVCYDLEKFSLYYKTYEDRNIKEVVIDKFNVELKIIKI